VADKADELGGAAFRTFYLGHDAEYRRRREQGRSGWDEEKSLRQTLAGMEEFLGDARLGPRARILELGCGAGNLMLHWAALGHEVAGVDISRYAVEWGREQAAARGLQAAFFVADVTQELEVPVEPADLVLDGHCLHCIIGKDRRMFFDNARKYLKPGGLLHINTMCGDPHHVFAEPAHFDAVHRCVVCNGIATRYFGKSAELLREVAEGGFEIMKWRVNPAEYEGDEDCLLVNARVRGGR